MLLVYWFSIPTTSLQNLVQTGMSCTSLGPLPVRLSSQACSTACTRYCMGGKKDKELAGEGRGGEGVRGREGRR